MFLGLIVVVFLVNGRSFIYLWVGQEYERAFWVAVLLLVPQLFTLSQRVGTHVLWAINKHKVQAILQTIIAFSNVLISFLLIVFYDNLYGAAIGTAISVFAGDFFILNIIFKKEIGIHVIKYNIGMIKGTILPLILCYLIGYIFSYIHFGSIWVSFVLNCSTMLLSYFILMLAIGFNDYEKRLFISMMKKPFSCFSKLFKIRKKRA